MYVSVSVCVSVYWEKLRKYSSNETLQHTRKQYFGILMNKYKFQFIPYLNCFLSSKKASWRELVEFRSSDENPSASV